MSVDAVLSLTILALGATLWNLSRRALVESETRLARVELRKAELEAEERARSELAKKTIRGFVG